MTDASRFAFPLHVAQVAEPSPGLRLDIAPQAFLPAIATPQVPEQQRALELARSAHATFDKTTSAFGNSVRSPIRRFGAAMAKPLLAIWGTTLGAGAVAAIGMGIAGLPEGVEVARQVCLTAMMGGVGAFVAFAGGDIVEISVTSARTLESGAVAPLRQAFDAAPASSLDRAVVARLAAVFLDDLDDRRVLGEPPRAVLRGIVAEGEALDPALRAAAGALIECFALLHDERGNLKKQVTEYVALKLEHALARTSEPLRNELRQTLKGALFNGDRIRAKAKSPVEARLYRVLTGADAPQSPPALSTATLEGDALSSAARELEGRLFNQDGEWARNLSADDARNLFAILRSTTRNPPAS